MRATLLLRKNIEALLSARGQTQHDLAFWCRRSDAWLSKILDEKGQRGLPLKYLDKIAEFFGISSYQLFQPGINPLLERRKGGERRAVLDRRVSQEHGRAAVLDEERRLVLLKWRRLSARGRMLVERAMDAELDSTRHSGAPTHEARPADPDAAGRTRGSKTTRHP